MVEYPLVKLGSSIAAIRSLVGCVLVLAIGCIEEHPDFVRSAGGTDGAATDGAVGTTGSSETNTTADDANEGTTTGGDAETFTSTDGFDDDTDGGGETDDSGETGETECTQDVCGTLPGCECCDPYPGGDDTDTDGIDEDDRDRKSEGEPCYSGDWDLVGIGVCEAGVTVCDDGVWVCDGEILPSEEVCNGLDDDCDGQIDDGFGQVICGVGICQVTVYECVDGEPTECVPGEPAREEVCNGLDDTCDGQVDSGCDCIDGSTQSCYTGPGETLGVGICEAGEQTCTEGAWGDCVGDTTPKTETCNGLDDDCNGTVDDDNPGGGAVCDTQLFGICKFGEMQCINGSLQCVQMVFPEEEVCDGQDNDCNGYVDDGDFGAQSCDTGLEGICADGTMQCVNGSMQCVQDNEPQPEICGDGLDNNCNGIIDDGCPCVHSKCITGGPLAEGCEDCVYQICQAIPSCCTESWTSACTNAVQTICECANCAWNCAHNLCVEGGPLTAGCDPGCVADVCDVDSYCCNNGWDSICLARVQSGGNFGAPIGYIEGVCYLSCDC
jgi:hypothetical protein